MPCGRVMEVTGHISTYARLVRARGTSDPQQFPDGFPREPLEPLTILLARADFDGPAIQIPPCSRLLETFKHIVYSVSLHDVMVKLEA